MSDENRVLSTVDRGNQKSITVSLARKGHLIPFYQTEASVVSRFDPSTSRSRYTSSHTPIYDIQGIPDSFHDQVRLCRHYYQTEPITGTVIDIMIQFSAGKIQHVTDNEEVKKFYDALYESASLDQVIKWILLEYYLVGNVFPFRTLHDEMVKTQDGMEIPKYSWTVLNAEYTHVDGSMLFGDNFITLEPNEELITLVKQRNSNPVAKRLVQSIPKEWIASIEKGERLVLDPNRVAQIARNKQPYQRYAVPFLMRAITPLRIKEKLIQMDLSTADGIINQLVTVTIGNDTYPATQEELDAMAELLNTTNKAYALLWNHTLNVKFHRPETTVFDPKKYEQVNNDIQAAFGITRSLIDGGDSGYGRTYVSISSLIERLEWGRNDIKSWLEEEYRKIAEEQGLPTYPKIRFSKINLHEDRTIKNILMQLYDRGVISAETVIEETGHNFKVELERMGSEKELMKQGYFISKSPYQQSHKQSPGRPEGVEDSEPRTRDPLPQPHAASVRASSDLEEQYRAELEKIYEDLKQNIKASISGDIDEDREKISALLLMFMIEMSRLGDKYLTQSFRLSYADVANDTYLSNPEAVEVIDKMVTDNSDYVRNFVQDLMKKMEADRFTNIDKNFESMHYRLTLYASEGVHNSTMLASITGHKKMGYDRVRWMATFENTCQDCADRHGRVFEINEAMTMYPAHVNCRCFLEFLM